MYNVSAIPTFVYIRGGRTVHTQSGAKPADLERLFYEHSHPEIGSTSSSKKSGGPEGYDDITMDVTPSQVEW